MTSIFEGQLSKRRPKLQSKQGAQFGFHVYMQDIQGFQDLVIMNHIVGVIHLSFNYTHRIHETGIFLPTWKPYKSTKCR